MNNGKLLNEPRLPPSANPPQEPYRNWLFSIIIAQAILYTGTLAVFAWLALSVVPAIQDATTTMRREREEETKREAIFQASREYQAKQQADAIANGHLIKLQQDAIIKMQQDQLKGKQ